MVCVTGQRSCERLIARGAFIREREPGAELHVVHCVQTGRPFMDALDEADAIEYLFTAAQMVDAAMAMLRADSVDDALVEFAQNNNVKTIVLGASPNNEESSFFAKLQRRLPDVEFDIVG